MAAEHTCYALEREWWEYTEIGVGTKCDADDERFHGVDDGDEDEGGCDAKREGKGDGKDGDGEDKEEDEEEGTEGWRDVEESEYVEDDLEDEELAGGGNAQVRFGWITGENGGERIE